MLRNTIAATIAVALAACAAVPQDSAGGVTGPEASIPFANQRTTIREWQPDGVSGIWVQDAHRNWYYGRFHVSCFGLDFANAVGFQTGSTGRLDRFSSIVVPGEGRCAFTSFVSATEPPDNGRRHREDAEAPAEPDATTP